MTSAIASRLARFLVLVTLLLSSVVWAETGPVEILGRLPSIENIAVSPDGSRLAMIRTQGDRRFLVLVSLADNKAISNNEVAGAKLRELEWADNNNLLITVSNFSHTRGTTGGHMSEQWVLTSLNVDKQRLVNPMNNMPQATSRQQALIASNQIIGNAVIRNIKDDTVVYVPGLSAGNESQNASGEMFLMPSLFKFKAGINMVSLIGRSKESGTEWLVDEQGKPLVENFYSEDDQKWTLRILIDGKWKEVISEVFPIESPDVIGLGPDGTTLLLNYFDNNSGASSWMGVSLADGKITRQLPDLEKYKSFLLSAHSPRVRGGIRSRDSGLEFFDSASQEIWDVISSHFEDERISFEAASDNLKKVVVKVEGLRDGYGYWLFDSDKFKFTSIGSAYSGFNNLAEVKRISYEAADKKQLEAFVTYPAGNRKNLPLVVMPHGGPSAHDDGSFDYWAQAFASQGYLVVQPNFRGSDTTSDLREAGFGEWGRKMQTDLSDVVQKLVKNGTADAKRVCIVGGSYGGYAALAGAALSPGTYRCAISFAGVSDLAAFRNYIMSSVDRRNSTYTRYFDRYLGISTSDDKILQHFSPVNLVRKIGIPVLLIHGTEDSVVPYKQSEGMYSALRKANVQADFVTLDKEDHYLSNSNTRLQALQAMVEFLKKNNPPN